MKPGDRVIIKQWAALDNSNGTIPFKRTYAGRPTAEGILSDLDEAPTAEDSNGLNFVLPCKATVLDVRPTGILRSRFGEDTVRLQPDGYPLPVLTSIRACLTLNVVDDLAGLVP